MSEKRHAQLDARNTDTYQRTKKAREDKDRSDDEYLQNHNQGTGSCKHFYPTKYIVYLRIKLHSI